MTEQPPQASDPQSATPPPASTTAPPPPPVPATYAAAPPAGGPGVSPADYAAAPGFWKNVFTLGIVQAKWVATVNRGLARGGAGFWFAWFLSPFANYGLAERLNAAHAELGSSIRISPLACFFFTGWPFIGARKKLKRSGQAYGSMLSARASA